MRRGCLPTPPQIPYVVVSELGEAKISYLIRVIRVIRGFFKVGACGLCVSLLTADYAINGGDAGRVVHRTHEPFHKRPEHARGLALRYAPKAYGR